MFIDFIISLWVAVLKFLSDALPIGTNGTAPSTGSPGSGDAIPAIIIQGLNFFGFYLDITPFTVLMGALSGLLIVFVTWKVLSLIFNWISGLL